MRTATAVLALLLTLAMTTPGAADWQPQDPSKWVQFPDLEPNMGLDVSATAPYLLADDFPCEMPGYITNIHIWGSWYDDHLPFGIPETVSFTLSIHADIPADESPTGYSMPGEVLGVWSFDAFGFEVLPWQEGVPEGWLEPPDFWEPATDFTCWQYNFELPIVEAFFQEGTPAEPVVYWLDVQATPMDPTAFFGWKTSIDHWNDDATWAEGEEPYQGDWFELIYPPGHPYMGESIDLAFVIETAEGDWGDAPDPLYPTLASSNGATHLAVDWFMLGQSIDAEADGQPHPNALGDDLANLPDEDGVVFTSPLVPGQTATVDVEKGGAFQGSLDAWVDFNKDGDWDDLGERIFAFQPLPVGVNSLSFNVPADAAPGQTFARFRLNYYVATSGPTGPGGIGEVEDYTVLIEGEEELDWGDADDPPYPTLGASNGASHVIVPNVFLGASIDADPDGQPTGPADGDDLDGNDDEDGVVFTSSIVPGQIAMVDVTASVPGFLDAWIDFEGDGTWAQASNQIFAAQPLVPGLNSLTFAVPGNAVSNLITFSRFRYSTAGGLMFDGPAPDGEVEDDVLLIDQAEFYKWVQFPDLETTGIDVAAFEPFVLADDFLCTEPGRITVFTIWGSWLWDAAPDPGAVQFTLSIHEDIPEDESPTGYSMPGELLWLKTFAPGEFSVDVWMDGLEEGWLEPPDLYIFPADEVCWVYRFVVDPAEAFHQVGTFEEPVVYWLDLQALPEFTGAHFGWKTSLDHWNDDAVWGVGIEPYPGPWEELRYPMEHPFHPESIDLAFALNMTYGTDVPEGEEVAPERHGLYQNVPNPFNPTTTIAYDVPAGGGHVTIEVFDVNGRLVTTLVDGPLAEGRRSVTWHGVDEKGAELPSGVYFYRMDAGDYVETRKMLLLK